MVRPTHQAFKASASTQSASLLVLSWACSPYLFMRLFHPLRHCLTTLVLHCYTYPHSHTHTHTHTHTLTHTHTYTHTHTLTHTHSHTHTHTHKHTHTLTHIHTLTHTHTHAQIRTLSRPFLQHNLQECRGHLCAIFRRQLAVCRNGWRWHGWWWHGWWHG